MYKYHNDFKIEETMENRALTYLWYLNDVDEGGETEFYNGKKIQPQQGKLLLFPSFWTHAHKANVPLSNNKYIITGFVILRA